MRHVPIDYILTSRIPKIPTELLIDLLPYSYIHTFNRFSPIRGSTKSSSVQFTFQYP